MTTLLIRLLLVLGGVTALGLSLAILFFPGPFYASYGIDPTGQTNLLNELKAPALVIMAAGLIQARAVVRPGSQVFALGIGLVFYLGFGLARLAALATDGVPSPALVGAMGFEIALGLLFGLALWRHRLPAISG